MTDLKFKATDKVLKGLLDVVQAIKPREFNVVLHGDTIKFCAADRGHIALIGATFAIEGGPVEPVEILLDVDRYKDAIKGFAGSDLIDIEVSGARMQLKKGRKKRTIALLDPRTTESPKIPTLAYDIVFQAPLPFLRSCMKSTPTGDVESVSLSVKNGLFLWQASNDIATDTFEDSMEIGLGPEVAAQSFFSQEYLSDCLDAAIGDAVEVSLGSSYPLTMRFAVPGGTAVCLLAPKTVIAEERETETEVLE